MKPLVQIRNMTLGEGLPKICIPLTDLDFHHLKQSAKQALHSPLDFVEWRADFYDGFREKAARTDALLMLREILGDVPLLFTIRTKEEGGQADISTEEYESINRSVIESRLVDLVDVELMKGDDVMMRLCSDSHIKIIGSRHDFAKTPLESEIVESLCKMQKLGAAVAKYAVMPASERDVLTLLSATLTMKESHNSTPVITMSMGRLGAFSRICGSLSGSCVTFGTVEHASAPGQLPADLLKTFLESLA